MSLVLQQSHTWQRTKPKGSKCSRRVGKHQQLTAEEKRRYFWQAVWIVILLLAACMFGGALGYFYTE